MNTRKLTGTLMLIVAIVIILLGIYMLFMSAQGKGLLLK